MTSGRVVVRQKALPANPIELWLGKEDIPSRNRKNLDDQIRSAWNIYQSLPMPTRMDEAWRKVELDKMPINEINDYHLKGKLTKPKMVLNIPENVRSKGIDYDILGDSENLHSDLLEKAITQLIEPEMDKYSAMSAAFADTGIFLHIPRNIHIDQPIRINLACSGDSLAIYQNIIWLEDGASATIILDYQTKRNTSGTRVNVGNVGFHIGQNASLIAVELQSEGKNSWNITHEKAYIEREGTLEWLIGSTGSRFSKSFIQVDLAQPGAKVKMDGFYITSGNQHIEFDTRQNHLSVNTSSDLLFKGVLLDESKSLFKGMIYVSPEAIKTDGYQANRNLLLGPHVHADVIPGLEILADDVRCTHGATVGKIDPEELFYLQSRGLDPENGKQLIVQGFLETIIQKIPVETDRIHIQDRIVKKMSS